MNFAESLLVFSIIVVPLFLIHKYSMAFIFIYPVYNVAIDILLGFIKTETILMALSRAFISILFILYIYIKHRNNFLNKNRIIIIFVIYLLFLIPSSSNYYTSFSSYLKVIITYSMFPVGYILIRNINSLKRLNHSFIWIMILLTANFIIANIFKVGRTLYSQEVEFYAGNIQITALEVATMVLLVMPLILFLERGIYKKLSIIFGITTLIFLLISLKRSAIIALLFGIIVYYFLSKNKFKIVKWIMFSSILLMALMPFYQDVFIQQIQAREKQLTIEAIDQESRYRETFFVFDEIFSFKRIDISLFGKEIFNSAGNYAHGLFGRRVLHSDINLMLHGSGIIGIILFFGVYWNIYKRPTKYKYIKLSDKLERIKRIIIPLYYSIFLTGVLITISGGMLGVSYRTIYFLILGSLLGVLDENFIKEKRVIKYKKQLLNKNVYID